MLALLLTFLLLSSEKKEKDPHEVWRKVRVFFGNSKLNTKDHYDCSQVFPVTRWVDSTAYSPMAALQELLEGPTKEEKEEGYLTSINSGTALAGLWVEDGIAKVNFTGRFSEGGGSCWVLANVSQIKATLKQFDYINDVEFPDPGLQP